MQKLEDQGTQGEIASSDHGEVPPVGTSSVPVSGKELPDSPVSGKPVSGNPVLSEIRRRDRGVPTAGTLSEDDVLVIAKRKLPSDFTAEHGGLLREFCRECRPALYEAVCAYLDVREKPRDLRGWFACVYRQKRDALRKRK